MKVLVTGSSGLIGSEAVEFYDSRGNEVHGVDNNMRQVFFGSKGRHGLESAAAEGDHTAVFASRDRHPRSRRLTQLFQLHRFDLVIHCAAQPSHDKAKEIPLLDFEVNALGTMNLLEVCRAHSPDATFIFMSTNKVYGDAPNEIPLVEDETRFDDYARAGGLRGSFRIVPHRPFDAFDLRCVQGRGGRHGSGIWPLFRHENRYLSRGMPDRISSLWPSSCTAFSAIW